MRALKSSTCVGALYGGICWYLGEFGANCSQTCTNHGGTSPDLANHVGTASQGGSLQECSAILGVLGVAGIVQSNSASIGVGCINYLATSSTDVIDGLYWIENTDYSDTASLPTAQLACGCRQ
jgi:hypothetical protein